MKQLLSACILIVIFTTPADPGKHKGHPSPTPTLQVTLAWNPSANATGYRLWVGFSSGGENPLVDVGPVTIWTLPLSPRTTYYFEVTAYDKAGESPPSNEINYRTP
jgi:hypothetical protein